MAQLKDYYRLTKPGIIRANVMTAFAGFLFASKGSIDVLLLIAVIAGVALVIASGCVFNNYIDRRIDKKMERTKNRALVIGLISNTNALVFASLLGVIGFIFLILFTNWITVATGVLAFVSYVAMYGYAKRKTVLGTLVGSLPGALSLVAGYVAVSNTFDVTALILLLIMVFWQMPHFYAIGIYRLEDYKAAALPILSVRKGIRRTRFEIILYIVLFSLASASLTIYSYAGYTYLVVMTVMSLLWLWYGLKGFTATNIDKWAKGIFGFSLLVLLIFSLLLSINNFLP